MYIVRQIYLRFSGFNPHGTIKWKSSIIKYYEILKNNSLKSESTLFSSEHIKRMK